MVEKYDIVNIINSVNCFMYWTSIMTPGARMLLGGMLTVSVIWLSLRVYSYKPRTSDSLSIQLASYMSQHIRQQLAPCGEVCQYTDDSKDGEPFIYFSKETATNISFPRLEKHIDCENIMQRMAWRHYNIVYPPPEQPPEKLLQQFTQNGEFPLGKHLYLVGFNPDEITPKKDFPDEYFKRKMDLVSEGKNINIYKDDSCTQNLIAKYKDILQGTSGLVVGTQFPWLEAILLHNKVQKVTTLEYNKLSLSHPQVRVMTPYDFADMYLNGTVERFDFATSFSSIEHSGLGRYGDPINPYGDMEAMAQMWCALKPGGLFIVGVPGRASHEGVLQWNAHRIYGVKRLKHLAANWDILEVSDCIAGFHVVMVLRKPF